MVHRRLRQVNPEEVQLLARIAGVEVAPERLERLAQQVTTVFHTLDQLDAKELQGFEPAAIFQAQWR